MTIDKDFVVDGNWSAKSYKVKFDFNINSSYSPVSFVNYRDYLLTKVYNTPLDIPGESVPVAFGHTFIGWGTKSTCLYKYENGSFVSKLDDKIVQDNNLVSDITLYAHWAPLEDTINTHYYNSSNTQIDKSYKYNITNRNFVVQEPTSRNNNPNENWVFLGWYTPKNQSERDWAPISAIDGSKFWGNRTSATAMGDEEFAWGTFRNPDMVNEKTSGSVTSPVIKDISALKKSYLDSWKNLKSADKSQYDEINSNAWGWSWHFYAFWTITGKYVMTEPGVWNKVSSAYVKIKNSDGTEEWKYISDLNICTNVSYGNPTWRKEVKN